MIGAAVLTLVLRFGLILLLYFILVAVVLAIWREMGRGPASPSITPGAYLSVLAGGATGLRPGESLPLLAITSIGRAPDSAIFLDDATVAPHHALLRFRDGRWWLEDIGSSTGTWVNRRPVETLTAVDYGDVIVLGQVRLRLESG